MSERVRADGSACLTCAAKMDLYCVPENLGPGNLNGKHKRFVYGRRSGKGTTIRPDKCPHPDSEVSTNANAQVMLRKLLNR